MVVKPRGEWSSIGQKKPLENIEIMGVRVITKDIHLDAERHLLIFKRTGKQKQLEPRLVRLLEILAKQRGQVVAHGELIQQLWGNYNSGPKLLTHSIAMVRKEIGKDAIKTIPKTGYMLMNDHLLQPARIRTTTSYLRRHWYVLLLAFFLLKMAFFPHH